MSILELKPEKVKTYLKLLTEACISCDQNKGTLRKDLWDFIYQKYGNSVDYRDFLLAIRRFLTEGKIINNDGIFEMHPEVIFEVREKTPTPALNGKAQENYYKFLKGQLDETQSSSSKKRKGNQYLLDSKISDSGKKQKVKSQKAVDNTSQSKIEKYYIKKHANNTSNFNDIEEISNIQAKPLGFATPAFDMKPMNGEIDSEEDYEDKETPNKSQNISKRMSNLQKQKARQEKKKQIEQQLMPQQQVNKKVHKNKKDFSNPKENSNKKNLNDKKNSKFLQQQNNQDENQDDLMSKSLQQEAEILKQRQRAEKEERKRLLKEKKDKVQEKKKNILTQRVMRALKTAYQTKNLKQRKLFEFVKQDKSLAPERQLKTKAIKKTEVSATTLKVTKARKDRVKKRRALNQLKNENKGPKLMAHRLRGKTLDLTELGIIKKKKEAPVSISRQTTLRLDQSVERDQKKAATPRQQSRRSSVQRQLPKTKAIKKTQKKQKQVKEVKQTKAQKVERQPKKQTKAKKQKAPVVKSIRVDNDRKAKIDAVKNLRQLYSKDKLKHALYIDEKLIYL